MALEESTTQSPEPYGGLRGVNLSPDATLEIDNADLPFQMLLNSAGEDHRTS